MKDALFGWLVLFDLPGSIQPVNLASEEPVALVKWLVEWLSLSAFTGVAKAKNVTVSYTVIAKVCT